MRAYFQFLPVRTLAYSYFNDSTQPLSRLLLAWNCLLYTSYFPKAWYFQKCGWWHLQQRLCYRCQSEFGTPEFRFCPMSKLEFGWTRAAGFGQFRKTILRQFFVNVFNQVITSGVVQGIRNTTISVRNTSGQLELFESSHIKRRYMFKLSEMFGQRDGSDAFGRRAVKNIGIRTDIGHIC